MRRLSSHNHHAFHHRSLPSACRFAIAWAIPDVAGWLTYELARKEYVEEEAAAWRTHQTAVHFLEKQAAKLAQ